MLIIVSKIESIGIFELRVRTKKQTNKQTKRPQIAGVNNSVGLTRVAGFWLGALGTLEDLRFPRHQLERKLRHRGR